MPSFQVEDLQLFLRFLGGFRGGIETFCILDEVNKKVVEGVLHHDHFKEPRLLLEAVGGTGSLHITLNRTNLAGRRTENITECRVLCIDLDRLTSAEEIRKCFVEEYRADLIVQSSPGKYHVYWQLKSNVSPLFIPLKLESWKETQAGLAEHFRHFGADPNLSQLAKTIRVPGIERVTKSGGTFIPQIVWMKDPDRTLDEALELGENSDNAISRRFPWIKQETKAAQKRSRKEKAELKKMLGKRVEDIDFSGYREKGRNSLLYFALKEDAKGTLTQVEALAERAAELNRRFPEPLDAGEVRHIVDSAWRAGMKYREWKEGVAETASRGNEGKRGAEERLSTVFPIVEEPMIGEAEEKGNQKVEVEGQVAGQVVGSAQVEDAWEPGQPTLLNGHGRAYTPWKYDYSHGALKTNRFTDHALLQRLLQRFGERLLRVESTIYCFDAVSRTWGIDSGRDHPRISALAATVLEDTLADDQFEAKLCRNAAGEPSLTKKENAEKHFQSAKVTANLCSAVLQSNDVPRGTLEMFNASAGLFFCANGVVDLGSGELREAMASDYLLARSAVEYAPSRGVSSWWVEFLGQVFGENDEPAEMIRFMQELFGYCLTPGIGEQKLFCHYGHGSNGKSKVLGTLLQLVGDYGTLIDPDELTRKKNGFSNKTFERLGSKIESRYVAVIDDLETTMVWNESFVKNLTSPFIRARAEYEISRVTPNRAKIHCGLNEQPMPESESKGFLRRLCFIPYQRTFDPSADEGTFIDERIEAELPGILNWAIEGYRRVTSRGAAKGRNTGSLDYPREVSAALEGYRQDHFTQEVAIENLFAKPDQEPEAPGVDSDSGQWITQNELLEIAQERLGLSGETISPQKLGFILKHKLKLTSQRMWNKHQLNYIAHYWVKIVQKK